MTATFLVELDLDDTTDLLADADEISDACENAGLPVLSVKPWARPTEPMILPSPTQIPRS